MACTEFPDNSATLFGREPDLAYLSKRCEHSGITAVVGRPQMGKSSILVELSRRMSRRRHSDGSPIVSLNLSAPRCYLVGFAEAGAESPDHMLRVVADLYCRWLSDSRQWEQARLFYGQHKEDLIGSTGEAVGTIFKELSKLGGKPMEVVGSLVKETFGALASANRDLKKGGMQIPLLQIEQSRELLTLLQAISHCKVILVFDQWDKSSNLEMEANIFDSFLHHLDEWPSCHMLLGVRSDEKPSALLKQLQKGFQGAMEIFDLLPMHLDGASGPALLRHLRTKVNAASTASDADLLEMIAGYPGVIAKWTASYNQSRIESVEQLRATAIEAQNYRYDEFETILPRIPEEVRAASMRLVLLPATSNVDGWNALRQTALGSANARVLDTLKTMNVLESGVPPSYGHATRLEAARRWFIENCTGEFGELCEELIFNLGCEIQDVAPHAIPFASSLADLQPLSVCLRTSTGAQAVCIAALALMGVFDFDSKSLAGMTAGIGQSRSKVVPLLAAALFNSLNAASDVHAVDQRDEMLNELRTLARAFPQDTAARDWLARGLFNTIIDTASVGMLKSRDALMDELRALAGLFDQDSSVRAWLAEALLKQVIDATGEGSQAVREISLAELLTLARTFPKDIVVRGKLAQGLVNALTYAKQEDALSRQESLLEELRDFARSFPEDSEVRVQLAMGLFNSLNTATRKHSLESKEALLKELHVLAKSFPHDPAVRLRLAKGMTNMLSHLKAFGALERRDIVLEDLRSLAYAVPGDAAIQQLLAISFFNVLNDSMLEGRPGRADSLLAELRKLAGSQPEDTVVQTFLAKSLSNMIYNSKNADRPVGLGSD
jgi:hypothetical protein